MIIATQIYFTLVLAWSMICGTVFVYNRTNAKAVDEKEQKG